MLVSVISFHFLVGTIAIVSGFMAILLPKGTVSHKYIGLSFLCSMLALGITGSIVAFFREVPISLMNGLFICYLVASSYKVIKQRPNTIDKLDKALLASSLLLLLGFIYFAIKASNAINGQLGGFGATAYIVFGSFAGLCFIGDIRFIKNKGLAGTQRLIRHLWRMMFPLFMSTTAFFLGQAKLLPPEFRKMEYLMIPVVFVIVSMVYWLIKVGKFKANQKLNNYSV